MTTPGRRWEISIFEEEPGRQSTAKLLARDEARRVAVNFGKLPEPRDKVAGERKRSPIKLRRVETPDQDRAKADDCLRLARAARTREERLLYLGLAAIWLQVALVKDGATDIRLPLRHAFGWPPLLACARPVRYAASHTARGQGSAA